MKTYTWNKINQTWLTLQCCFSQIILHNGDNNYNIKHILKEKLECSGQLPDVMDVVEEAEQLFNTTNACTNNTDDKTIDEEMENMT